MHTTGPMIRPFSKSAFSQRVMLTRTSLYRWRCSCWKRRSHLIDDNPAVLQYHHTLWFFYTSASTHGYVKYNNIGLFACCFRGDKAHEMLELQHPTERARQRREVHIAILEKILLFQHPQHH
ncbi:uncharacterized [Tachysurus ichikawai]